MRNNINAEERLSLIVSYFLTAIGRLPESDAIKDLKERVLGMTIDEFDCIYDSLAPYEQAAFDPDREYTTEEEMSQYMIYTKALNRYWDAKVENTWMGEDGILCITENSTFLETPVTLNTYMELSQMGVYSIKEMQEKVARNVLSSDALIDISAAVIGLMNNTEIRVCAK